MIDLAAIKQLSTKYQINQYVVAREYLQIVVLKELYEENFSKDIFFKGGTAIRIVYGGQRFSEDLDFTSQATEGFEDKINKFFQNLTNNYPVTFKERKSLTGKSYLLTGKIESLSSPVFIRTDFSLRENVLEPTNQILRTDYPVIVQNFIRTLSKNEMLAEKVRAIIKRKKHRDIYDFWVLLELGAEFNTTLISKKMEFYGEKFDKNTLLKELGKFNKDDFTRDLSPLVSYQDKERLPQLFDYVLAYATKAVSLQTN
ncbi:MAG: nucleotidyl transferase AbiEii/AbiGii toxin family protein [Patescibacteria group bacterium]|jgi:predicted nucleotidyltransferase component of viral defense system